MVAPRFRFADVSERATFLAEFVGGPFDGRRESLPISADGPSRVIEVGTVTPEEVARALDREGSGSPVDWRALHGRYYWHEMVATAGEPVVDRYRWEPGILGDQSDPATT